MTTTLASLLLGDLPTARQHLLAWFGPAGLDLSQITVSGIAVQPPEITNAVVELLDVPLGSIAARAWGDHDRVRAAKRATAQSPGARQVVRLLEHSLTSTQSPKVEASVGGASVTVLELDLEVELTVSSVDLVVEHGEIVQFAPGSAVATVSLSTSGTTIAEREFEPVELDPGARRPDAARSPAGQGANRA